MNITLPRWALGFVLGAAIGGAAMLGVARLHSTEAKTWEEWSLPARFEGNGAVTLGCAFWDVPFVTPYGPDNPKLDMVSVQVAGDSGDVQAIASVDGPGGTAFLAGSKCAISVDWSVFPQRQRPFD